MCYCETPGSPKTPSGFGARVRLLAICSCTVCGACAAASPSVSTHDSTAKPIAPWVFANTDGSAVTSNDMRGRSTILLFITTYDPASQIAASRLDHCVHTLPRRVNTIAVAMEAPDHAVLVSTFHDSLRLSYPVLMPDPATLAGQGPFGTIDTVPTWIILDQRGQEVWRGVGVRALPELADTVSSLDSDAAPRSHGCS
jgi:hypothetical protein